MSTTAADLTRSYAEWFDWASTQFPDDQHAHVAADAAVAPAATQEALGAIGAWSDLDWYEMEQALDRIRHESNPTPPITDL